jgi:hypothetical protein
MNRILPILIVGVLRLSADPSISYSKFFKGSVPEYVSITVAKSGDVTYKEAPDDDQPIKFQLSPEQTSEIFGLANKLDNFGRPLESPAKVANMGLKTFRFEDGAATKEVKFNYSEDADARLLADWFERITETEQDFIGLERAVKFDRLGVNKALLQLQLSHERKRLVGPQQFLPLLDRISKNESFMHMSRERAASLAEAFRSPQKVDAKGEK